MMDKANSVINKKMADFEKLKKLLNNNLGYIGKFTEFLFNGVPYSELKNVYEELIYLRSKSVKLDINLYNNLEDLLDIIQIRKEDVEINSVLKQFPSKQKDMSNNMTYFRTSLLRLYNHPNKKNFISKISRYKTELNLFNALKLFLKSNGNEKQKIIDTCEKTNTKILYNENNILILFIKDYEQIREFGSDTSWCISGSKHTFNNYTRNKRKQLIVFDYNKDEFDPFFKIGITISSNTMSYAYNMLDTHAKHEAHSILLKNNISIEYLYDKCIKLDKEIYEIGEKVMCEKGSGEIIKLENDIYTIKKEDGDTFQSYSVIKYKNITSNLSYKKWELVVNYLTKPQIKNFLHRVLNWSKTTSSKINIITLLIKNYFKEKPYILRKDIVKIDQSLLYYTKSNIYIDDRKFNIEFSTKFKKAYYDGNFSDQTIVEYVNTYSIDEKRFKNIEDITFYKRLLKDLIRIYNENKVVCEKDLINIRYYREFEAVLMILLDKFPTKITGLLKEDYDKLMKPDKTFLYRTMVRHNVDIPIHLDYLNHVNLNNLNIVKVVKKDYGDVFLHIQKNHLLRKGEEDIYTKYKKIIKHLKGFKIGFKVSKSEFKYYYIVREQFPELESMMEEIYKKRFKKGICLTNGNISLKIS
jgi:hypothetical protein